eukprot:gene38737-47842_t
MNLLSALLGMVFGHLWNWCTDGILSLFDRAEKNAFNAEFGKETLVASRFNKGFVISKHRKLTRRKSFENVLLAGPTGSGKTTRLLIKNLFELRGCTIIVNDPSKELYLLASGYLSKFFTIKTLNFSNAEESSGFNPLSRIKKTSDINRIAQMLVAATLDKGGSSDPFWGLQSRLLISIFIRLIKHQPEEMQHLGSVLKVLNHFAADPDKVDRWIVATGDEKLLVEYKAMVKTPERTLQNIVASAKAALIMFDDEEIVKVTSHDSIDFDELRRKPHIIFLHDSVTDKKYTSTLNAAFFEQAYAHLLNRLPGKKELDLFFILEEASSLYIPTLPLALANARKHRVGTYICVQQPDQMETMYKDDAKNIYGNCVTKLFLPGITSMNLLRELETLSGKATVADKKGRDVVRPLLTVDELRMLKENRVLVVSGNHPYIMARTSPYFYSWFRYLPYSKIEPVSLKGDIPDGPVSYIV